ncbi:MAG: BatD family protein [Bacteroidales bacterium]|nr:BatD family protein [Bacteroidales bacterium]
MMKRYMLMALSMLFAPLMLLAQSSIKVQAPNVVAVDEQFNVTFIIEGEGSPSSFSWSEGDAFQLVWGPQKGTSTSITIVNGKRSKSTQSTYTYVLLPKKTGNLSIPVATAEVNGKTISSTPASIEVVSGGSSSSASSSQQSSGSASSASTGEVSKDDLFLRFSLSRTNVVVGEPINATLKLYQRVNIAGFEDAKFPTFAGFWSQETFAPQQIDFKRENVDGKIYNTAVLRSYVLIPQQAGNLTIDPAELVCLVNVRAPHSTSNSIFDSFFEDEYRTIRKRVSSAGATVHVAKLPAGAPDSFGGGVGTFDITASLSKERLKAHDAASLTVTISGKGNVSLLEAPKVDFPSDFEVYDVKTSDNTDKSNGRISGSKTFEYPFIPRSHGDFVIPPVKYSYYDINAGRYVTASTDSLRVSVERGAASEENTTIHSAVPSANRKDVKSLGEDIRFIVTSTPSLSKKGSFFLGSALFWILTVLTLLSGVGFYFGFKGFEARRADVAGSKNRQASKMARKRLSRAGEYLKGNLHTAFYEELHRTLLGFVSDKLNMDSTDMSKENIASSLMASGVSESLATSFTDLLDACEFARYAPDSGHEAMNSHYETAVEVISSIDSSMKRKPSSHSAVSAICALFLLLPATMNAAESRSEELWQAGVESYSNSQWDDAISSWTAIEQEGLESAELYYNIGNAYFKKTDYAHSIIFYERALKLDPSYKDARANLEFVNSFVQDRIESVPEFVVKTWLRNLCWKASSGVWAGLFLVFLLATVALVVLFLLARGRSGRTWGFFGGIVSLLLAVLFLSLSLWEKSDYEAEDTAIVMVPVTSVKSAPGSESTKDLFVLHEGTKVEVLETVGTSWSKIELSDGRQGWIKANDIEII